jgi:hypothetical protein
MRSRNLEARIARFRRIFRESDLKHPLLAVVDVPQESMINIVFHAELYLSAALKLARPLHGDELLSAFEAEREALSNVTPTGMILPKQSSSLEYNLLLRSYYQMIVSLYIAEHMKDCHTPAHLRVKWPEAEIADLQRPRHAPEEMHFDTWSGYSSHGFTFLLGVLGDVEGNRVRFFDPPNRFEENWLLNESKPSSEALSQMFEPLNIIPKYGQIVVMDSALLHQTFREQNSGIRFSIDNIFRSFEALPFDERIEPARGKELTPLEDLARLGATSFYFCDHLDHELKDSKGGSVDPTQCQFVRLN